MIKSLHIPLYLASKEHLYLVSEIAGIPNTTRLWWGCKTNPKYYLDFYSSKEELDLVKDSYSLVSSAGAGQVFTNKHTALKSMKIPDWTNSLGQKITSTLELVEFSRNSSSLYPIWATDKYSPPYRIQGNFADHFSKFFVGIMAGHSSVAPIFISPVKPFETSRPFTCPEAQVLIQQWAEGLAANKDVKEFLITSSKL